MEQFMYKTVSKEIQFYVPSLGVVTFTAARTRTSKGFASIELRTGTQTALQVSNDVYGDNYESIVRDIAALLVCVADNPCTLPVTEQTMSDAST